jgi:hypothetical protein
LEERGKRGKGRGRLNRQDAKGKEGWGGRISKHDRQQKYYILDKISVYTIRSVDKKSRKPFWTIYIRPAQWEPVCYVSYQAQN